MIKTLYQIGRVFSEEPAFTHYFKPWQNPYPRAEEATVLVIDVKDKKLVTPIKAPEAFRPNWLDKYVYRDAAGARGTHITPTSKFFVPKKAEERAESLAKFYDRLKRTFEADKTLTEKYLQLEGFWEEFKPAFETAVNDVSKEGNLLVTFRFDGEYPGSTAFKDLLFEAAYDKYKKTNKASYVGRDHTCAVTHEKTEEVWGKVDTLGFTVDDEAFIRGGFETAEAWKMFPVSKDVVPVLEGARTLVLDRLRFGFFKFSFLIVPRFIGWDNEFIKEVVKALIEKDKSSQNLETQTQAIINTENLIAEIIADVRMNKPGISFDFFFYQQKQAQFSVKLHLSDVMPSRMRVISDKKKSVENRYRLLIDKQISGKGKKEGKTIKYFLTFGNLKDYFSETISKEVIFHPVFFQILEAVFYQQEIPEEFVLKAFHDKLVTAFKNYDKEAYQFANHGYQTFAFYHYLAQLGIFHHKPAPYMENQPVALTLDEFLAQHSNDFLKEPDERAAFLAGCLVERLLKVQRDEIKSEPFRKYLHNLNLDPPKIMKIMLKWEEKVNEYIRAKYLYKSQQQQLEWESLNAEALPGIRLAMENKNLNKTKFSYAFTMGMVMQKAFTNEAIRKAVAAKKAKQENAGS